MACVMWIVVFLMRTVNLFFFFQVKSANRKLKRISAFRRKYNNDKSTNMRSIIRDTSTFESKIAQGARGLVASGHARRASEGDPKVFGRSRPVRTRSAFPPSPPRCYTDPSDLSSNIRRLHKHMDRLKCVFLTRGVPRTKV